MSMLRIKVGGMLGESAISTVRLSQRMSTMVPYLSRLNLRTANTRCKRWGLLRGGAQRSYAMFNATLTKLDVGQHLFDAALFAFCALRVPSRAKKHL